uniref:Uncharacterized protein n=1 Tax=Wuchereria bancrofti TaxID=6293 RepID=A0A1I8EQD2_WUCBA
MIDQICYNEGLIGSGLFIPHCVVAITLARRVVLEMNANLGEVVKLFYTKIQSVVCLTAQN